MKRYKRGKRPSLRRQNHALRVALTNTETALANADANRATSEASLRAEIDLLKDRQSQTLLKERRELCNSIGQLTEAISKAIIYIVGKEQI